MPVNPSFERGGFTISDEITSSLIQLESIRLHVVITGPVNGPPVILLHGFPEFWYGWRSQIPALAGAGYRVLAPDQRGYNLSSKPGGLSAYRMDTLAGDVVGLMDRLGYRNVTLVGHDWGGVIAWVTIEPSSPPGTFHAADFDRYRQAWAQPGAIMGMLNWYRAFFRRPFRLPLKPRLQMPVLVLWGTQDVALSRELAEASIRLCEDGELVYFEDASHWIQHQEAEKVNQHLLSFFHQRASPI